MPLIPGLSSTNPTEKWTNLLVGKSLSDDQTTETHFSKKELPEDHRVLQPDSAMTMDYRPDRLNVHVNKDGVVEKVTHG